MKKTNLIDFVFTKSKYSKQTVSHYGGGIRGLLLLLLVVLSQIAIAQETPKISVGIDYSLETINLNKTKISEQFSFNNLSDSLYNWSSDEISDFNQGDFVTTKNNVSFRIFSGLTGNDSSKFRFGFGVHLGFSSLQEQTSYKDEIYLIRKSSRFNLEGGASAYMHYCFNKRWKVLGRINASFFKSDLNNVKDYDEFYDNTDDITISYNNSIFTLNTYTNLMGEYTWKDFDFQVGPQLVFNYTESTYNQLITDNAEDDVMRNYEYYEAINDSFIRAALGIRWNHGKHFSPFMQFAIGKDLQLKIGIQF
jgi:hypothetical protein